MYKLVKNPYNQQVNIVQKQEGNILLSIPFDPDNTDYQAFLKYQAEGGKVYGADEEIPADEGTQ
jgi:hypothetical protein